MKAGARQPARLVEGGGPPLIHRLGAAGPECKSSLLTSAGRFISRPEGAGQGPACGAPRSQGERTEPQAAMLPTPAVALDEQQRQQQRQHLAALLGASARPWPSLWPPPDASAPSGSSSGPAPAAGPGAGGGRGAGGGGAGGGGAGEAAAGAGAAGGALSPWDVALCAAGTAVAGENALVLAALALAPGPRGPAALLVGSLALADLLAGLGLLANFAARHLLAPPSETAVLGAAGLLLAAFSASLGSLLAIALDRYLSLSSALTYQAGRGRGAAAGLLALMWLLCLAGGLPPLLGWHCLRRPPTACSALPPLTRDHAALLAGAFLLAFALLLQLYLRICKIAVRHAQQIAVQHQFLASAAPGAASSRRGLATLALVLGTFALCWVPLAIYALVADATYPPAYAYSLALPATCHSLLNPFVYAFRNPDIQKSLWLACCGCCPASLSRPRTSSDV